MVAEVRERGIGFTLLHENLDTTPGGQLVFHGFAAELIREVIVQGIRERLAAARARGYIGGRPTVATEEIIRAARDLLPDPGRSITSKLLGVSPGPLQPHPRPARTTRLRRPASARRKRPVIPGPDRTKGGAPQLGAVAGQTGPFGPYAAGVRDPEDMEIEVLVVPDCANRHLARLRHALYAAA